MDVFQQNKVDDQKENLKIYGLYCLQIHKSKRTTFLEVLLLKYILYCLSVSLLGAVIFLLF